MENKPNLKIEARIETTKLNDNCSISDTRSSNTRSTLTSSKNHLPLNDSAPLRSSFEIKASFEKKRKELTNSVKKMLFATDAANLLNDPDAVAKICDLRQCVLKDKGMEANYNEYTVTKRLKSHVRVMTIGFLIALLQFVLIVPNGATQSFLILGNGLTTACLFFSMVALRVLLYLHNSSDGKYWKKHTEWITFWVMFLAAGGVSVGYSCIVVTQRQGSTSTALMRLYQTVIMNSVVLFCLGLAVDVSIQALSVIFLSCQVLMFTITEIVDPTTRTIDFLSGFGVVFLTLFKSLLFTIICKYRVRISERLLYYQHLYGYDGDIKNIKQTAVEIKENELVRDSFDMPAPSVKGLVSRPTEDDDENNEGWSLKSLFKWKSYIKTEKEFNVFFETRIRQGAYASIAGILIIDIIIGCLSLLVQGKEFYITSTIKISIFILTLLVYIILYKFLHRKVNEEFKTSTLMRITFNLVFTAALTFDSFAFILDVLLTVQNPSDNLITMYSKTSFAAAAILSNIVAASALGFRPGWFFCNAVINFVLLVVPLIVPPPEYHSEDFKFRYSSQWINAAPLIFGGSLFAFFFVRHLTKLWYTYWSNQIAINGYVAPRC